MEERQVQHFIADTRRRVDQLIHTGIWEGVDTGRVASWSRQLGQSGCELLAACVLDNLTFRSKAQVLSLLTAAFMSPALLPEEADSDDWILARLRLRSDPGIRLVPVIALDQPPTKSGPYMLRLLARSVGILDRWMIWAERLAQVPANVHTVVAVDDFCGSGTQFSERFLASPSVSSFRKERPDCRLVYVAAAAHEAGITALSAIASDVAVVAGEVLTKDCHFFDGILPSRYGDAALTQEVRQQYDRWVGTRTFGARVGPLGFDDQALLYGFAHSTPNNALPVLWHSAAGWEPLLDR